jgi:plastocyanin
MRRIGLLLTAGMLLVLSGCRVKDTPGNAANGKELFVQKCGSCHVLSRAGTKGSVGPSLDAAFAQDRADGIPSDAIRGVVHRQILYPSRAGAMPGKLVTGDDAYDVATYVAATAAKAGKDTGALAQVGQAAQKKNAKASGGKLAIPADPTGQLAYLVSAAAATPGKLEIDSQNKSGVDHDIALTGPGVSATGPIVKNGGTSTIKVDLKPGTYTFFCTVPGHRQAGMEGKLTVKS